MKSEIAIRNLEKDLAVQSKKIESMLPDGLDVRKFMRTAVNGIVNHPQADQMLSADRQSLFAACQKAASDGLLLDGKEATMIAFFNKKLERSDVSYIPMTQGLIKLARNSGEILSIRAEVVFKNDQFTYRLGIEDQPIHAPDWFGDRGDPIGAYAVVSLKSGEKIVSVFNRQRIMTIANSGRNSSQYDPQKGTFYIEWWRKTVIKNALKYAPKSTYLESAMDRDNETVDSNIQAEPQPAGAQELNSLLDDEPVTAKDEVILEPNAVNGDIVDDDII